MPHKTEQSLPGFDDVIDFGFLSPNTLTAESLRHYLDEQTVADFAAAAATDIDFTGAVQSYGKFEDRGAPGYTVADGGASLHLSGNTWKKIALPDDFIIAEDTVLRFTFEIPPGHEGETHAIGLDSDDWASNGGGLQFQLAGSQSLFRANQDYAYDGGTVTYEIDLGAYAGQTFKYLTFINDDDRNSGAESTFSNISFVSGAVSGGGGGGNSAPTASTIDAGAVTESDAPVTIDLLGDAGAADADGDPLSVSNVQAVDGSGNPVATTLVGRLLTIDPGQFAAALDSGEQANVSVSYDISDGQGGVIRNTATLVVNGEGGAAPGGGNTDGNTGGDTTALDIGFGGPVLSYGVFEDRGVPGYSVEADGSALRLSGNTWKKIALPDGFTIGPDTVLRFTFEIPPGHEGETHAIGLDTDDWASNGGGLQFQLAGTQSLFRVTETRAYDGGSVTYEIDLGDYAGRSFKYLTFINDDDRNSGAESVYSNISFVSGAASGGGGSGNTAPTASAIDAGTVAESDAPITIDLLAAAGASDADGDPLSVRNVQAVDSNGNPVATSLVGRLLTIDPGQFADSLNAGQQASVTVRYEIVDGKGGVTANTASLLIDGEGGAIGDTYISGLDTPNGFNIEIVFSGSWSDELKEAFVDASELISDLITGDVQDAFYLGELIDDIRLVASLEAIDGTGGILGRAGPTVVRQPGYLPAEGIMEFDVADANLMLAQNIWQDVIFHEMMHTVGFGTLWQLTGLLTSVGGDLRFTGDNATQAYAAAFPSIAASDPLSGIGVPVETDGGAGTASGHWDEDTFGNEVMTGYADSSMFLSDMTIASLQDLGYETAYDDPFFMG